MGKIVAACVVMLLLISCATVGTNYKNPVEEAMANKGQYAKVIFHNDADPVLYPSFTGIEVILDGMLISNLKWHQQIEVYIKKGRHDLLLTHWDIFKFTDHYEIELSEDNYQVELFCRPISTVYEIKQIVPQN